MVEIFSDYLALIVCSAVYLAILAVLNKTKHPEE
jgi:hypothetical protein